MFRRSALLTAIAVLLTAAATARAQEHNRLAVGIDYTHRTATDPSAHGDGNFGLKFRLGRAETGWGWYYGLNWYNTNLDRRIGARDTKFGELKIKPILGGYGYTRTLTDRLTVEGDIIGGFGFTSFNTTTEADDAFRALSSQSARVTTGATPVLKPEVAMWYDINRKFGISVDAGYIIARPRITISSPAGSESSRFHADTFMVSAGVVYRIF